MADRKTYRRAFTVSAILLSASLLTACGSTTPEPAATNPKTSSSTATAPQPESQQESATEPAQQATGPEAARAKYDIDSPGSITVVVNKQRPLRPLDYYPEGMVQPEIPNLQGQPLRPEASAAATEMYHAVKAATGAGFAICSGFRSYDLQAQLYRGYAAESGQQEADQFSARPGHSEHQTGLAMDIVAEGSGCRFDDHLYVTATGQWMNENAWRYGFILRYDYGLQPIVGYMTEEWHWRFIGKELAAEMHHSGVKTLEEFFGTGAATEYAE